MMKAMKQAARSNIYTRYFKKFFADKDGNIVVLQSPNAPLWIWIIATILSKIWYTGLAHDVFSIIGFVAVFVWSGLELGWGSSIFRRVLGFVVLAFTLIGKLA